MNIQELKSWLQAYPQKKAPFHKPLLMGIINITPDSFSDGGRYMDSQRALQQIRHLIQSGADIIDIGGESSRPGALPISAEEECDRILPMVHKLRQESDICISIDTHKPLVAEQALAAGADMINDITALRSPEMRQLAIKHRTPVCLMHMQGTPQTMQQNPCYTQSIIDELHAFFEKKITSCLASGILKEQIILDPGFGFGKNITHNLMLLKHLQYLNKHGFPLLLGVSRKHTIGVVLDKPADQRLYGSIGLSVWAGLQGVAILRTHDVDETHQALKILEAVLNAEEHS